MLYPLGNDEHGAPIDVPPQATGWLVRRHAGGKGRPGTVYDAEGRPLVVPLTATATDLRAAGLGPGFYRLDAVDGEHRRVTEASAYTELAPSGDGDLFGDMKPASATDAALLAMCRVVMQRQRDDAKREEALAMRLLELTQPRLNGLTLKELDDIERHRERSVSTEIARRNAGGPPQEATPPGSALPPELWWVPHVQPLVQPLVAALSAAITTYVASKVSGAVERRPAAQLAPATATPVSAAPSWTPPAPAPSWAPPAPVPSWTPPPAVSQVAPAPSATAPSTPSAAPTLRNADPSTPEPAASPMPETSAPVAAPTPPPFDAPAAPAPPPMFGTPADEALGGEMFIATLGLLGVPVEARPIIADRLDALFNELDEAEIQDIGQALTQLACCGGETRLRDLLTPLASMTRAEGLAYARATLIPALQALTCGSTPPTS